MGRMRMRAERVGYSRAQPKELVVGGMRAATSKSGDWGSLISRRRPSASRAWLVQVKRKPLTVVGTGGGAEICGACGEGFWLGPGVVFGGVGAGGEFFVGERVGEGDGEGVGGAAGVGADAVEEGGVGDEVGVGEGGLGGWEEGEGDEVVGGGVGVFDDVAGDVGVGVEPLELDVEDGSVR